MKCSQHFDQQIQKVWNLYLASCFCRTGNTGKTKFVKFTKFCVHIVFTRNFQIETYKYYFILRIAILFRFQRYQTHDHSFLFLPSFGPKVKLVFLSDFSFLARMDFFSICRRWKIRTINFPALWLVEKMQIFIIG